MADQDKRDSRSAPLRARVRSTLGEVRRQGAASLRDVQRSVSSATERLKSTQTAEQLSAAVEIRRVLKKAASAQRRGNHAMAYRLLEPAVAEKPDDARVIVAFWTAALGCERAEEAVPAMLRIVRKLASAGEADRATELWMELREATPSALVDPNSLVRIAPVLQAGGQRDQAIEALRQAVDPRNSDVSPGIAVRIAEMTRELDPPTALKAAGMALATPDLHEARRERLVNLIRELESAESEAARAAEAVPEEERAPAVEVAPEAPVVALAPAMAEAAVAEALEAAAPAARFADIKPTEGMPTTLQEEGVALQLLGGRKARLEYAKIEAVAVAEVAGLAAGPVIVIDLVLNWSERGDRALHVLRLRSDGFDPRMMIEGSIDASEAFRAFLSELLARSHAVPLPDPDSALGLKVSAFDSLEAYQREVLQVDSQGAS